MGKRITAWLIPETDQKLKEIIDIIIQRNLPRKIIEKVQTRNPMNNSEAIRFCIEYTHEHLKKEVK
jgi:hypothetical protein